MDAVIAFQGFQADLCDFERFLYFCMSTVDFPQLDVIHIKFARDYRILTKETMKKHLNTNNSDITRILIIDISCYNILMLPDNPSFRNEYFECQKPSMINLRASQAFYDCSSCQDQLLFERLHVFLR